jgi:hypothetical protein
MVELFAPLALDDVDGGWGVPVRDPPAEPEGLAVAEQVCEEA